jgi:hypothetical protein
MFKYGTGPCRDLAGRAESGMRFCLILLSVFVLGLAPARADVVDSAFSNAIDQFERAMPRLPDTLFGVDVPAYRDALTLRRFSSPHWGSTVELRVVRDGRGEQSCTRYAAFVRLPPSNGKLTLVLCPQFDTKGADALRTLTVLHEMVHVVAGKDECRAMAFAARIEFLATGAFTPVGRYWQANRCESSGFSQP